MKDSLICVTVEVQAAATSWRTRIVALSIARALELAGDGKPGHRVCIVFPINAGEFFTESGPEAIVEAPGLAEAA